jgi:hypothetical protein
VRVFGKPFLSHLRKKGPVALGSKWPRSLMRLREFTWDRILCSCSHQGTALNAGSPEPLLDMSDSSDRCLDEYGCNRPMLDTGVTSRETSQP